MARQLWTRSLALVLALLVLAPSAVLAQKDKDKKTRAEQDISERPHNIKKEKTNVFKKWVDEDVAYIITEDEKRAWKKLQNDAEREKFS